MDKKYLKIAGIITLASAVAAVVAIAVYKFRKVRELEFLSADDLLDDFEEELDDEFYE